MNGNATAEGRDTMIQLHADAIDGNPGFTEGWGGLT